MQGHLISQGMVPMAPQKVDQLLKDISTAKQLLADSK